MNYPKIDFLYLNEQDMIDAGVNDMSHCISVIEEVYSLLSSGDYVMGGSNHNSHGQRIVFPKESPFPNMPLAGPDRRFMSMIAYIGGRFNIAGEKWYGSNRENLNKGLPRSILMVLLNDADTGAPLALQSANLLSAMRTGAIAGVGAKYFAREDAKVLSLVAAGTISKYCLRGIVEACKGINEIRIYDIAQAAAAKLSDFIKATYPQIQTISIVNSLEEAVRGADIISSAASGKVRPKFMEEWIKPGAFISLPSGVDFDEDFIINRVRKTVDNWKMYEARKIEYSYPFKETTVDLASDLLDWIHEGKMTAEDIDDLSNVVAGVTPARYSDDEIIVLSMGGQPVYDVAWGAAVYENAKSKNIGTSLNLWDKPALND